MSMAHGVMILKYYKRRKANRVNYRLSFPAREPLSTLSYSGVFHKCMFVVDKL